MKKSINLCVDLITLMKEGNLKVLDSRKGSLFRNEEDKFTFTEKGARPHEEHLELHWQTLERCKNGKVSANATHVKLELYIPHGDYRNGSELADILMSQTERLGESLCEIDMAKVVASIQALKKEASC